MVIYIGFWEASQSRTIHSHFRIKVICYLIRSCALTLTGLCQCSRAENLSHLRQKQKICTIKVERKFWSSRFPFESSKWEWIQDFHVLSSVIIDNYMYN